ncbi:MAG: biotin carboxylase N-terminal domain-containing protein [Actinomycetaceae bacterium]|nr:biotin carboxylase N-terminal domain-containing protein [Actinomycetaceae bacterium]MDU0969592.1 biotin carboxylase N-terminal domain-containing protein [Actinomycetaceae bacterium]
MSTLMVANRGEIAVRVIRTAREMGIRTVAVYAESDIDTLGPELADEAFSLGGALARDTYLNPEALLAIAQRAGVDAIHPGYGFLSEDAAFARAVLAAGMTWIGPSPDAICALGDKIRARQIADSVAVPTIPGISQGNPTVKDVKDFAAAHGYPVLIKQADSGGGRGITRLDSDADVDRFFTERGGDATLQLCFIEKFLGHARHVETQCMRDRSGEFRVVTTRDCSVQRRNQKVIEEAPAPHLDPDVAAHLTHWSRALFDAVDYVGVGTCEFLVSGSDAYFLEVNPRLQVEHTVSEEVAGIDLVREQIRISQGHRLTPAAPARGHAIEVRITSENPADDLMPTTGEIRSVTFPAGLGVRLDTFVRSGDAIGGNFDSLIAKVTVSAPTRAQAIARLVRALDEFAIDGLLTSVPLIRTIITHPDFVGTDASALAPIERIPASGEDHSLDADPHSEFAVYTRWLEDRQILDEVKRVLLESGEALPAGKNAPTLATYIVELAGKRMHLKLPEGLIGQAQATVQAVADLPRQRLRGRRAGTRGAGTPARASVHALTAPAGVASDSADVVAPIQATVVRVAVEMGDEVGEGDLVAVLEAMKMEKYVHASCAGTVTAVAVTAGSSVNQGDLLVALDTGEMKEE